MNVTYTTKLQAGLGMLDETRELLHLWEPGMNASGLHEIALGSGRFHSLSARRLRNIVAECFAPRYLVDEARPARLLKSTMKALSGNEFRQLCLVFTCRANPIVADFIRQVYWAAYSSGRDAVSNDSSREFVEDANRNGHTTSPWSESTVKRVSGYLTGILADFGLLEPASRGDRRLIPFRLETRSAGLLVYDLHFQGVPDTRIVTASDWELFGLGRVDVVDLLKRLSLLGWFVYQAAGESIRLGWKHHTVEELANAVCNGKL